MPHYNQAQSFHGFVNLAQLCSSPAILQDHDMVSEEPFDFDPASHMSPGFPGGGHEFSQSMTPWSSEYQSCHPMSPPLKRSATLPMTGEYSSSSPSNPPSPAETVQSHQHQKRRAQNRAAQRAYRDRKVRHLHELEQGIRDIEKRMMHLQNENTELIRRLCEMRVANNDLKASKRTSKSSECSSGLDDRKIPTRSASEGDQPMPLFNIPESNDTTSLYEPFAAMWNLIRLDPLVVQGKVSARTILENLSRLAETGSTSHDIFIPPSPIPADDEDSPPSLQ